MKLLIIVSLGFFLSSCATMSRKECKVADWKDIGYQDAMSGYSSTLLEDHKDACAKAKIKPNKVLYLDGYKKGEKEYCTYRNGIKAGENNKSILDICNSNSRVESFHHGYKLGKKRYKKQKEIKSKVNDLDNIETKIQSFKDGKLKIGVKEIDLLYREREIVNKEIILLEIELDNL